MKQMILKGIKVSKNNIPMEKKMGSHGFQWYILVWPVPLSTYCNVVLQSIYVYMAVYQGGSYFIIVVLKKWILGVFLVQSWV
jgi:hypothetical protein